MTERDEELIQVVLHPALNGAFRRWLKSRGLVLFRMPIDNPDDLPTYGIGPDPRVHRTHPKEN